MRARATAEPRVSRQSVYVARQPILNDAGRAFGYELLYRGSASATACTGPGDVVGAQVLTNAVLALGLDTLTQGLPAFVNLTRQLLVTDAATLLPPDAVVLEVLEDIVVDAEVIEACQRLKKAGLLTRDPRMKERKKYGQKGARARFQFSKR